MDRIGLRIKAKVGGKIDLLFLGVLYWDLCIFWGNIGSIKKKKINLIEKFSNIDFIF